MNFLWKKEPNPPPLGQIMAEGKSSSSGRSAVFIENSKLWTKSHTGAHSAHMSVSSEEGRSTILLAHFILVLIEDKVI